LYSARSRLVAASGSAERGVAQRVAAGLDASGEPPAKRRHAADRGRHVVPARAALEWPVAHALLAGWYDDGVLAVVVGVVDQGEPGGLDAAIAQGERQIAMNIGDIDLDGGVCAGAAGEVAVEAVGAEQPEIVVAG